MTAPTRPALFTAKKNAGGVTRVQVNAHLLLPPDPPHSRIFMKRLSPFLVQAAFALLTSAIGALAHAQAQNWPSKAVRIITPFPAGAGPEAVVRVLADKLSKKWGKPVIVENKPGGNGFIAIDAFKRGAQDGYDLMHLDNVHLVAYPYLFKKLPYDPAKDFDPLLPLFRAHFFVTVPSSTKYKTVGDILADARANPNKLNYGSWSIGNPVHLGSALLETMSGTQMQHVTYKEVPMLYAGVATGELDWALGTMASAGPLQRTGKLKFIGVTAPKRLAAYPDVPTVSESGGPAGYEVSGWTAIAAPKGLPMTVVNKIQSDIAGALAEPDMKERYSNFGYESFPIGREQFSQFISTEAAKYAEIVRRARVSLD